MYKSLAGVAFLGLIIAPVSASPVTPSFTTGTVTSHTETITTVNETIKQTDFQTGWTYTASGTNIDFQGPPQVGTSYGLKTPGASFQFSETYFGPGESRFTQIERTTVIESVTDSISVFTQ